jgi:hypothetical protein
MKLVCKVERGDDDRALLEVARDRAGRKSFRGARGAPHEAHTLSSPEHHHSAAYGSAKAPERG